jgi:hypothetical protein
LKSEQAGVFVQMAYFDDSTHLNIHKRWGKGQQNEQVLVTVDRFIQERLDSL